MCKAIEDMVNEATFQTLCSLLSKNKITLDDALEVSPDRDAFIEYITENHYGEVNG